MFFYVQRNGRSGQNGHGGHNGPSRPQPNRWKGWARKAVLLAASAKAAHEGYKHAQIDREYALPASTYERSREYTNRSTNKRYSVTEKINAVREGGSLYRSMWPYEERYEIGRLNALMPDSARDQFFGELRPLSQVYVLNHEPALRQEVLKLVSPAKPVGEELDRLMREQAMFHLGEAILHQNWDRRLFPPESRKIIESAIDSIPNARLEFIEKELANLDRRENWRVASWTFGSGLGLATLLLAMGAAVRRRKDRGDRSPYANLLFHLSLGSLAGNLVGLSMAKAPTAEEFARIGVKARDVHGRGKELYDPQSKLDFLSSSVMERAVKSTLSRSEGEIRIRGGKNEIVFPRMSGQLGRLANLVGLDGYTELGYAVYRAEKDYAERGETGRLDEEVRTLTDGEVKKFSSLSKDERMELTGDLIRRAVFEGRPFGTLMTEHELIEIAKFINYVPDARVEYIVREVARLEKRRLRDVTYFGLVGALLGLGLYSIRRPKK